MSEAIYVDSGPKVEVEVEETAVVWELSMSTASSKADANAKRGDVL